MPTQAPAQIQLRWFVVRVLLAFIAFLLGFSSAFSGMMTLFEREVNRQELLWGWIYLILGIHMGLIGWLSFMLWFIDLAEKHSENVKGSTRIEW